MSRREPVPINTEGSRQQQRCCLDHRPCSICSLCFPLALFSHHPPNSPQTSKYFCLPLVSRPAVGKQQFSRFGHCNYWSQTTMAAVNLSPRHLYLTSPFLQKLFICVQWWGCFCWFFFLFFFFFFFSQGRGKKKPHKKKKVGRYKNLSSLAPHWRNWLKRPNRASNNWSPRVGPYHTSHTFRRKRKEQDKRMFFFCFLL